MAAAATPESWIGEGSNVGDARPPGKRHDRLVMAALMVGVAGVLTLTYWPVLSARVLFSDDYLYIVQNHCVRKPSWSSATRFLSEVTEPTTVPGYYEPWPMISLMLDYAMGGHAEGGPGDNLRPFHRTALCLHVMNTLLVMLLVYVLFGHAWAAAAAGLLFGLHPMQVESIAWISQRKTLLGALFAFSCLILYVRYARNPNPRMYVASLAACVLALMSKPTALPLPVLLLLLNYWPLKRLGQRAIVEILPFFAVALASGIITLVAMEKTAYLDTPGEVGWTRIPLILSYNVGFYLHKLAWPTRLSAYYPYPEPLVLTNPAVLGGLVSAVVLTLVLVVSLRWTRAFLTGWLLFFVAIFPAMGLFKVTPVIAADRYVYLPLVGIAVLVGWVLARVWSTPAPATRQANRSKIAAAGLVMTVIAAQAGATRTYLHLWKDNECMFRHMVTLAPDQRRSQRGMVNALIKHDKIDEAIAQLHEWIEHQPDSAIPHKLLGTLLVKRGRLEEAGRAYADSLRLDPNSADTHYKLGRVLLMRGDLDLAVKHCGESIRLDPNLAKAHFGLATALVKLGKLDRAIQEFTDGLRLAPDNAEGHYNLAVALLRQGRAGAAVTHLEIAVHLKPGFAAARATLARVRARQGRAP